MQLGNDPDRGSVGEAEETAVVGRGQEGHQALGDQVGRREHQGYLDDPFVGAFERRKRGGG
jgi:hypothetical protein